MASERQNQPAATPLDAEREALRKAGYTDAEVSQILVTRAASQQPAGAAGQGVMSNVLSSIVAVGSHARALIPTFRKDVETVFDRAATTSARAGATASLAVKAVVIAVLGYAAWQEWNQHIISATERAAADARRAQVEADAMAHRPCLVQGVDGCQKFGLNAAEAEAAAKTAIAKGVPAAVPPVPDVPALAADQLKHDQARLARISALVKERDAHGLTEEQARELANLLQHRHGSWDN
jgi:hypothetical protein